MRAAPVGAQGTPQPLLPLLLITLAAFALGPIVLTNGLWRAGTVPPWPAVLWLVGALVVNAAEASSRTLTIAGMLAAAVGLAWLGTAVSNTSSAAPSAFPEASRPTSGATASDSMHA